MHRFPSTAVLATLAVVLAAPAARGSVVRALTLKQLVARASAVAVVTVESAAASWVDGRIVTDSIVRVDEALLGAEAGDRFAVRTLGGEVDDVGQRVFGEPWLQPGKRYLVFLEAFPVEDGGGLLRPVGMAQGACPVAEGEGGAQVLPSPELPMLVEGGTGAPVEAWLPAARALADVLADVRTELGERP